LNATDPFSATRLPLPKIRPGENPRRYFDRTKHDELVASFRLRGMLQPMLVRPAADADGAYVIVAGERRYRAALEAFGAEGVVPVIVREMTDQEALEAAIDENDLRDDASETEQADAAVRVLAACQNERAEAARRLGWSPAKLDRRLALANLSAAAKLALDERRIKVGHAELLAAVPGDKQDKALDTILSAGLDVVKTRELLMRVTQSLAAATFDKTECTTCPFNSGTQRALFETHVDDGACTNPGCFQLKTEAAAQAQPVESAAPPAAAEAPASRKPEAPAPAPAPKAATKPAPNSTAAKAVKVTAASIASRVTELREAAWRTALIRAVEGDPEIARAFEATLRDTWKVDQAFLGRFNKDELKFIAQECGLVEHMGARKFARLLESKPADIVAGMLNATGFSWDGRLPSAITLDGKYGPPPSSAAPEPEASATTAVEKE
jgi:ParB/RepB/Spo0J family partition protein